MHKFFKYKFLLTLVMLIVLNLSLFNLEVAEARNSYNFELGDRTLGYGDEGVDIVYLQVQLRILDYYQGDIDGLFGRKTLEAVKEFQAEKELTIDGVVSTSTFEHLKLGNYIEQSYFSEDKLMALARAINGEARGEPFRGQVAVGAVILNRVDDNGFPNSVEGVIYEQGQFSAVIDGQINLPPTSKSIKAAKAALVGYDPTRNARYFYNPRIATRLEWISNRPVTVRIDNHVFAD
ncbi:cell wall hydrolase [Fuchsiella alkaliacetigena]|uniref:cell wall hydrolase n=1 Tax=Fuchsiella alkaliacetigena TaxID=957042 RepID=UPI00200B4E6B|nr:cell wall hydrolase [Fuchsiella alkaliacetigena]MCK8825100.1 cell wall hydrolase [Fuchsiella alkaliacetigena]